jgi:hypothetical protein
MKNNKENIVKDMVVIIPIHETNEEILKLLDRAIKSVPQDIEIRLSCKNGLSETFKQVIIDNAPRKGGIVLYEDSDVDSKSDFATLVNQAVRDSKWFSILEFDDVYTSIWFDNVKKYIDFEPDVSVFIPLVDLIDYNTNSYVGFGNEAAWASSFSNELGYIDNDCLQSYFDFYLTGSVFNTEDWLANGGLKSSIKISFWYEFLLRMTQNHKKVFVIPKMGYQHFINRNNSLFDTYAREIDTNESNWWFELAKQESFFKEDRNKVYNKDI